MCATLPAAGAQGQPGSRGVLGAKHAVPNLRTWCPEWWRHAEAISRLEALWRVCEHLRLDPATGMSVWFRDHADHHMAVLLDSEGPFKRCSVDKGHSERQLDAPARRPACRAVPARHRLRSAVSGRRRGTPPGVPSAEEAGETRPLLASGTRPRQRVRSTATMPASSPPDPNGLLADWLRDHQRRARAVRTLGAGADADYDPEWTLPALDGLNGDTLAALEVIVQARRTQERHQRNRRRSGAAARIPADEQPYDVPSPAGMTEPELVALAAEITAHNARVRQTRNARRRAAS
jgi:hypothetical protein